MVTAPKSGAEIIPFLKTYVNLPGAIAFTALYAKLTNKFSRQQVRRARARRALPRALFAHPRRRLSLAQVFNGVVGTFLVFFALFATVIYPNAAMLHPTAWYATRLTDAHRRSIHPPTTRVSRSRLAPSVVAGASGSRRSSPPASPLRSRSSRTGRTPRA